MRERLTRHMADPGCAACHRLMDPAGLALEGFDGLGRFRDTDGGRPLDLTGTLDDQSFDGAQGLARAVRAHPAGRVLLDPAAGAADDRDPRPPGGGVARRAARPGLEDRRAAG